MDELTCLSAARVAALIRGREVSPVEVVEAYLRRIERVNPELNAVVTLDPLALDCAREAEAVVARGGEVGPLHGVPVTVKDTIETRGLRTTSGSRLRAEFVPKEDAGAVARLRAAGAIIFGKTNVPEMAIPYECDNPVFGRTNNPYDAGRTSGGSSGGEAAAVSACLSAAGLGSDLSGSIRVPAHFCGVVGLKPTIGRVPCDRHCPPAIGPLALGAVVGPMARCVEDLSLFLSVLTGPGAHGRGARSLAATSDVRGWRVARFVDEGAPVSVETEAAVEAATRALADAGLVVVEEGPPGLGRAIDLWPKLFSRASTGQLRDVYGGREEEAGPVVRAVLAAAEKHQAPEADEFTRAVAERERLRDALLRWMEATPFVIAPVGSVAAFEHGARRVEVSGGRQLGVFRAFGYSRAANVLGLPAVSVPAGRTRAGLPLGVQLIGRPFEEEALLAAASIIEAALGGWARPTGTTP
ncbi:MAG TPA: amidase [Pyrinomonadaceae bacterium]|nr:amidase [Pyrinomonadaceae bacterium]